MSKAIKVKTISDNVTNKLKTLEGKSAKIRFLNSEGFSRKEIADMLKIRYQHVRNVLVTVLKKDNYKSQLAK